MFYFVCLDFLIIQSVVCVSVCAYIYIYIYIHIYIYTLGFFFSSKVCNLSKMHIFFAFRVLHSFRTGGHEILCVHLALAYLIIFPRCVSNLPLTLLHLRTYTNRPPTHTNIQTNTLTHTCITRVITKLFLEPHLAIFVFVH